MADVELVIKIPSEVYENIKNATADDNDISSLLLEIYEATPLPKGHGRLIDADALGEKLNRYTEAPYQYALTVFNDALTIIEADKESEE